MWLFQSISNLTYASICLGICVGLSLSPFPAYYAKVFAGYAVLFVLMWSVERFYK